MEKQLVNVRLDPERMRKVLKLRQGGIALSDLVREAVDRGYEKLRAAREPGAARQVLANIFANHPDGAEVPARREYDVADARQARAAIQRRLHRSGR